MPLLHSRCHTFSRFKLLNPLLSSRANPKIPLEKSKWTPFHLVVSSLIETAASLVRHKSKSADDIQIAKIDMLFELKADMGAVDKHNFPPEHYAVGRNLTDNLELKSTEETATPNSQQSAAGCSI
ncbi:hypothetical protein TWF694_004659 [Orbilia ellipsospora]|uniref:Uncharacterized protein n=1 Tax=Orbilia ellipsospora TaxID=2528407 RepID=A0AAV9WX35_9PEZI